MQQPTLKTSRLLLRPFALEDAADVQRLAGAIEIARTTLTVPHPYEDGLAQTWIATHSTEFERGTLASFAVVEAVSGVLLGNIRLVINEPHASAELGFWLGIAFWNRGFITEATREMLHYGFEVRGLHRIEGCHLACNPASGRVMQKVGMQLEGVSRQAVLKWGQRHDLLCYAILRDEWKSDKAAKPPL